MTMMVRPNKQTTTTITSSLRFLVFGLIVFFIAFSCLNRRRPKKRSTHKHMIWFTLQKKCLHHLLQFQRKKKYVRLLSCCCWSRTTVNWCSMQEVFVECISVSVQIWNNHKFHDVFLSVFFFIFSPLALIYCVDLVVLVSFFSFDC